MEKEPILNKTQEVFATLETENIVKVAKDLTFKTVMDNPLILALLAIVLSYAVIKRSKFILLFLFTLITLMALVHYTLPTSGDMTSLTSLLPFAFGCLGVGSVLIYFIFIKVE
jgi:FtsH-binding integral membrane protein